MQAKQRVIYDTTTTEEPKPQGPRVIKRPEVIPRIKDTKSDAPSGESMPIGQSSDPEQEAKLNHLVTNSQTLLFKCRSVFPFDFFPDEISIEPTQVNLKQKIFFFTSKSSSIPIKNISDVIVNDTLIFAGLTVIDQFFHQNSLEVSFLWKHDAHRIRKIIQGLIIASREDVDTSKIAPKDLKRKVEQIGKMQAID